MSNSFTHIPNRRENLVDNDLKTKMTNPYHLWLITLAFVFAFEASVMGLLYFRPGLAA